MSESHTTNPQQYKYIAIILALLSLISLFAMLHHPSISATDIEERIKETNAEATINSMVHGTLIAFTILISICLTFYAQLRGTYKVSLLPGIILYWLGTIAMITAALMSGFVQPWLAEIYTQANSEQLHVFQGLSTLTWLTNQAYAFFGAICWCTAICFWSFDMLKRDEGIKIFGVLSFVIAAILAIAMVTDNLPLNVSGMTLVLFTISAWQVGIACLLFTQK